MFLVCQSQISISVKIGPCGSNISHIRVKVLQLFMSAFLLHSGSNSILEIFTVIHLHSTSYVKFGPVEARQSVLPTEY